jgi:hypothetical protein
MDNAEMELAKSLAGALEQCLAIGFQTPLHVAAIAVNGAGMVVRYDQVEQGLAAHHLADFVGEDGLTLPINLMITDTRGEAARIVIGQDNSPRFLN